MKSNDDLRRLLRGADPAEGRALPATERARMRAAIRSAAAAPSRRAVLVPALGVALVAAAVVLLARPAVDPVAKRDETATRATRIVFTAPEGTRILWFVAPSERKEPGS